MPAQNQTEESLVGMLRQRTEEEDLKQYLKGTLGGYTKKSVREYLTALHKQQQSAADTFNQNMQALLEEKEELLAENETLQLKLAQSESDYECLTDTLKIHDLENTEFTLNDIITLKNHILALEAESASEKKLREELEKKLELLKGNLDEKEAALEKSRQETRIQMQLLASEKFETKKQREKVAEYSGLAETLQQEIAYLKEIVSEGKIAKLNEQIGELLANGKLHEMLITQLREQAAAKAREITVLAEENSALRQNITALTTSLDSITEQNEKLAFAMSELSEALEAEHRKVISLLNEKAGETVEKLIAQRKLDEARVCLSLGEMADIKSADTAGNENIIKLVIK
jgi:chromosome segregation ATPase